MLSFCFENDFDDVLRSNGSSYDVLNKVAENWEKERLQDEMIDREENNDTYAPLSATRDFYNGLGKKMGYSLPDYLQRGLNNTNIIEPEKDNFNIPLTMSDEEKEDFIKNGSDTDKFDRAHPSFGNAIVPFEYRSNDNVVDPGMWGGA